MSTKIRKLTYEDYLGFPDDGRRQEIIDGDHYLNPAPSTHHQYVSRRLQFQLYTSIELEGLGSVIYEPVDVQLTEHDIVQPDLVVILKENHIITPTKVKGAPNDIIEILSPSTATNDRQLKRSLYERCGVAEYWIVDPFEHAVLQSVLSDGQYAERAESERLSISYLPGIEVNLKQVC